MTGHAHPAGEESTAPVAAQRLDKWLWFARIAKSRTLAAQLVQDGKVRVNRAKVAKPAHAVRPDCRSTTISAEKVENVVKPPQNPVVRNSRHSGAKCG